MSRLEPSKKRDESSKTDQIRVIVWNPFDGSTLANPVCSRATLEGLYLAWISCKNFGRTCKRLTLIPPPEDFPPFPLSFQPFPPPPPPPFPFLPFPLRGPSSSDISTGPSAELSPRHLQHERLGQGSCRMESSIQSIQSIQSIKYIDSNYMISVSVSYIYICSYISYLYIYMGLIWLIWHVYSADMSCFPY